MRRTALVTGAYGYLGSSIRGHLEANSWTTRALVRSPRRDDAAAVAWSLAEPPSRDVLEQADALVHCAYDFAPRSRKDIWRVNVDGSTRLFEAARTAGVERILVLSTMSAYEGTEQLYGRAKLEIEASAVRNGGIAIRPGLVYGPNARGMVGTLLRLTRLPVVPVIGGSAAQYPVLDDDLVRVVGEVLESATWLPEVFGVAQKEPMRFRDVLSSLAEGEGRSFLSVPIPWWLVYGLLRMAEVGGLGLTLRSDSVLGLVRQAPGVPRSRALPDLQDGLAALPPPSPRSARRRPGGGG